MKPLVISKALGLSVLTIIFVLRVVGQPALAFQETEIVVTEEPMVSSSTQRTQKSQFQNPEKSSSVNDERTTIRIPGLGVVGTVPKLNFGLELLYKDEEEAGIVGQSQTDDLSIKGTLKHKF